MLNIEKYENELRKYGVYFGLTKEGSPVDCKDIHCEDCAFHQGCTIKRMNWLLEEYKEPLSETAIELVLNLIEPFEIDNVKYIIVKKCDNCYSYECINGYTLEIVLNWCYIKLYYECGSDIANLFKELELDKKYTPKELGLC